MSGDDSVIDVTLSDDDDIGFFRAAPRTRPVKKAAPPAPPRRSPTPVYDDNEDDDDEEDGSQKKRKRLLPRKKSSKGPDLPEWTRRRAQEVAERKEREKRERERRKGSRAMSSASANEVIELSSSSDNEPGPSKHKKSAAESKRRRNDSPELTPPPEVRPEQKEAIRLNLGEFFEQNRRELEEEAASRSQRAGSSSVLLGAEAGPKVTIRVTMVADPDRKLVASATAIREYEKTRVVHIRRFQPLQEIVNAMCGQLNKQPSDFVLAYNGRRIFALSQTPGDLGIMEDAEMEGFEKPVWEKVSKLRAQERIRLLEGEDAAPHERSRSRSPTPVEPLPEPEQGPPPVLIKLRSAAGELPLRIKPTSRVNTMLRFYCDKKGIPLEHAENMYVEVDGEQYRGDDSLGDLDLEDNDIIDVGGVPA